MGRGLAGFVALVLGVSCGFRGPGDRGSGRASDREAGASVPPFAVAESVVAIGPRGTVSVLTLETREGIRARATLRMPRGAQPRSVGAVVIAGGFENGWRSAAWIDPGPGAALLSVDYPFAGPRRHIPARDFARRAPDFWRALHAMEPLLRQAAAHLVQRPEVDSARIIIAGGSLGVPFALRAAVQDPRFRGVAVLYGGADIGAWTAQNLKGVPRWARPMVGAVIGVLFRDYEPERLIGRVSPRPVLLVSGRGDPRVPENLARRLFDAAKAPREQVWLEGGHMSWGDEALTRRLLEITLAWARRQGFVAPKGTGPDSVSLSAVQAAH